MKSQSFYTKSPAARPERSSFCEETRRTKKREWRAEKAAIKKYKIVIRCFQMLYKLNEAVRSSQKKLLPKIY